jgi:hypothetical protein
MVSPAVREAVSVMTDEERRELRDYLDQTLQLDDFELTDEEMEVILRRDAAMDEDPSIGIPGRQVAADIRAKLDSLR